MSSTRSSRFAATLAVLALVASGCVDGSSDATDASATESAGEPATVAGGDDADTASVVSSSIDVTAAIDENQTSHADQEDLDVDESDAVAITLDGATASADSDAVTIDGATITITASGTYALSGTLVDGDVIVDADDADDITLILDGVDITNTDGAALAVIDADEVTIVLADDSANALSDGAAYVVPDPETDEPNAALYSAADLTIAGDGTLTVTGEYNDAIASKDGLHVVSGTVSVIAVDDGIRGKDYTIIDGGVITVEAGGDGIKADNDEDAERGYVLVSGGEVDIAAGDDGIQAATDVLVTDGRLVIDAGSVSGTGRAIQGDVMVSISGGSIDAIAADDAIHSNDTVAIDGGTLSLAAGDDGVHGDLVVRVGGGTITITEAFEGIEAEVIEIADGAIDITSDDDGLNVASAEASAAAMLDPAVDGAPAPGAAGGPPTGGRGGGGPADEAVGEYYIYIDGGTISITITDALAEQGDGIDANGHVVMTGGTVSVSGPTDTRNSALDYSGGTFTMTGGTLIGTNIDGRNSQGVGAESTQASLYVAAASTISAGTMVDIRTTDGESLITFEPANDYSVITFSSPDLVEGESYDVYLGSAEASDLAGTVTAS